MTAVAMLAAARKSLGLAGRPNFITRDYAKRHGNEFLSAPWCDMAVTYWSRESGNAKAVLPEGDRAYTVWHAEDGRDMGRWFPGTSTNIKAHAKPGAIVFFDWDGTDTIGRIDHVGVCEVNLGDGRMQTIEGNTGDACKRRVRASNVIAGFWNPPYSKEDDDMPSAKEIADAVYERFSHTVAEDVWASREGILDPGQKIEPRTALRQIWAYGKDGYHRDRDILVGLEALTVAVKELAASRDGAVDVEALMARIQEAIESVSVSLHVGGGE
jgi:hypothetical protein